MRIGIEQTNLLAGVQFVANVLESDQVGAHQLSNTLISAEEGKLRLLASNMNITLSQTIDEVGIEIPGKFAVPGRTFASIVQSMPGTSMVLETYEGKLRITGGRGVFNLRAMSGNDYEGLLPPADKGEFADEPLAEVTIATSDFKPALASAATAMAPQRDFRLHLQAVLFEIAPERFRLVSTDMSRMCVATIATDTSEPENPVRVLVGRKSVQEINRFLVQTKEEFVNVILRSSSIVVEDGHHTLRSNVVNQSYPSYEHGIPREDGSVLVAYRGELSEAVHQASLCALQVDKMVRFDLSETRLKVSSQNEVGNRFETELPIEYEKEFAVGFNGELLCQIFDCLNGDQVRMFIKDHETTCKIEGSGDRDLLFVLGPMRL